MKENSSSYVHVPHKTSNGRRFHVVVVQWTSKKYTKNRDARAELLFWSLNLLLFWSRGRGRGRGRSCLSSLMWGGLQKIFFWPFEPQFGLKIRGGRPALPPGPFPWIRHCFHCIYQLSSVVRLSGFVFHDRGRPCFWNLYTFHVVRVNCFENRPYDPVCVPSLRFPHHST